MIEVTKACKVAFMKARDSFVVRYRVSIGKKTPGWRTIIFQSFQLIGFGYHQKVVHGSTKLFMDDLLSNGLHEKVMICLLKVD